MRFLSHDECTVPARAPPFELLQMGFAASPSSQPFFSLPVTYSQYSSRVGGKKMARSLAAAIEMKVSAALLWETIKKPDIVPQLMPDYVAACEFVEGNGGVGSIRLMKFGPAVAQFVTFAKEKIELVDEDAKKLAYSVIDGELLNEFKSYQVCVEVVQGAIENECTVNWTLTYEPINPEMPSPDISKQGAVATFKAIESYLLELALNKST